MNTDKTTYSVYCLVDPRDPDHVRYVGKARYPEARLKSHIRDAKNKNLRRHKDDWIRSLLAESVQPSVTIMVDNLSEVDAFVVEKSEIERLKTEGHKLTNGTVGGEGVSGHVYTPAQLEAKRAEWRDPAIRAARIKGIKEAWSVPGTRNMQAARIAAAMQDDKIRSQISESQLTRWAKAGEPLRKKYSDDLKRRRIEKPEAFDHSFKSLDEIAARNAKISESVKKAMGEPAQRERLRALASRLFTCECGLTTTQAPMAMHQIGKPCSSYRPASQGEIDAYRPRTPDPAKNTTLLVCNSCGKVAKGVGPMGRHLSATSHQGYHRLEEIDES